MDKRQLWVLIALSFCASAELFAGRIVLPVVRRRWASSPALPALEVAEVIMIALLLGGALVLAAWMGIRMRGAKNILLFRRAVTALLIALGVAEIARLAWATHPPVDFIRHAIAVVVTIALIADALIYGTTLARAGVSIAGGAILCATLSRGIAVYLPVGGSTRWLAIVSEAASLLVPWVLSATVIRRRREDFIALTGAMLVTIASAGAIWGLPPAVRLLVAQALGFRFALPLGIHVLTIGAFAYFLIRCLRSEVIPPQVTWAYLWVSACGVQMQRTYVQMGALVALAIMAWMPPMGLPRSVKRLAARKPVPQDAPAATQ